MYKRVILGHKDTRTQGHKEKSFTLCLCDFVSLCSLILLCLFSSASAEEAPLDLSVDLSSETVALPAIYKPNIDLSGRGFHKDNLYPQSLSAPEAINTWKKDLGFSGYYRIQYNLWEIYQFSKDKESQAKVYANYDAVIKDISDAGGTVILTLYGTPAGMGSALDKRSAPANLEAYKKAVKEAIRSLSCAKKYNIWYEVWSAPDLDDFFLGRRQDYLNTYRMAAEAVVELEKEYKINIPVGGPSSSWWFQNFEGNTILTAERSLVYDLIKFCYSRHLPVDFISWHAYSSDPLAEKENTIYKKIPADSIREWLVYFKFDANTPLIVDEWNFDRNSNILAERQDKSHVAASYYFARLKNMLEAGVNQQVFFCLEDFKANKEGLNRNVGVFSYESESSNYKGGPKGIYNSFKALAALPKNKFRLKAQDDFSGIIAAKNGDSFTFIIYNYADPAAAVNFLSRNIAPLSPEERNFLVTVVKSDQMERILSGKLDLAQLNTTPKVKAMLKSAKEAQDLSLKFSSTARPAKLALKNIKETYLYKRVAIDASCGVSCEPAVKEEKEISAADNYSEDISLEPYSVQIVTLKIKPKEEPVAVAPVPEQQTDAKPE